MSGQIGARIARATGFEDPEDIRIQIVLANSALDTLKHLLDEAEQIGLLASSASDRIVPLREALRQDFPDAFRPRPRPAAPSAAA